MSRTPPVGLVVATLLIAACTSSSAAAPPDLPDHRGRFVTTCELSHTAADDPIVFPGEPGTAHLHEFFGNVATDATADPDAIADAATTCETAADRAAYWVPALLDGDGDRIAPDGVDVYYRSGRGVRPADVEPYPFGLQLLAGDARSRRPQPTGIVGWSCSDNPERFEEVPECAGDLRLRLTFPDCWNGTDLATDDHVSHLTYSSRNGCPGSHPVAVPQLELVVRYPVAGGDDLSLSSGAPTTAHGDFWNLWDPDALAREVRACLHHDVVCGDTRT